jgi:predicted Rossmann fold nucleotide-binding protein DprA/Smf involved in DNA uptake
MRTRTDSALASLLLTNRLVDTGVAPLRSREYWELLERLDDPAKLLGSDAEAIAADHGFDLDLADRLAQLLDAGTGLALALEELERQGVRAISPFDEAYPGVLRDRLGAGSPPVLYGAGPLALLAGGGVAVVGSRNVGDEGAQVARTAAQAAARRGAAVISGGAKGTDQLAMDAAFHGGGPTVGVLADSLVRRLGQPDVRRAIHQELACLVTPYKPTAGFTVANAMGRNKIVYALPARPLAAAADHGKGGTWEGAVEALRKQLTSVLVWMGPGAGPGNEQLVERGAAPITDLDDLFTLEPGRARTTATQLRLA